MLPTGGADNAADRHAFVLANEYLELQILRQVIENAPEFLDINRGVKFLAAPHFPDRAFKNIP